MKTYIISAKERDGVAVVPMRKGKATKDDAMQSAWLFSQTTTLCDVVLTQGSKHVATYRNGKMTHLDGKEHKV